MSILEAIAITAELLGTELSKPALLVFEEELLKYPKAEVLKALERCRRELQIRLTLAAVIERLELHDGRPSADEAWAMALESFDEHETVVWTSEARIAAAAAAPVLEAGDKVGARMAFREAYDRVVREARAERRPVQWAVSEGWDKNKRERALNEAHLLGRITAETVQRHLPPPADSGPIAAALAGAVGLRLVVTNGTAVPAPGAQDVQARIAGLRRMLKEGQA